MLRLYLYARVRFPCAQLHTRPWVQRAPGLPCALQFRGRTTDDAKLGRKMSREEKAVSIRHCERSEAIHASTQGKMDCFAALAMTWRGRMPRLRGRRQPLARHTVCITQSSVAMHLSSKDAINPSSRCAHLELKSRHQILHIIFVGPPGIATAMTYFRRTKNELIGWIRGVEQKIKSVMGKR
jgi:hypothetical protein